MRIGEIRGVAITTGRAGSARPASRIEPAADAARAGEERMSRALVPIAPPPAVEAAAVVVRPFAHAPFLAQLLAQHLGQPQTRRLRRTPPARAAAIYARAAEEPTLLVPGYFVDVAR